jgi:hypothetical protein
MPQTAMLHVTSVSHSLLILRNPAASVRVQTAHMMNDCMSIGFSGIAASASIEKVAREQFLSLGSICPELRLCNVGIEQVHRPRTSSRPYVVRLDLAWGRHDLTLSRIHDRDPLLALQDAFVAAKRYLSEGKAPPDVRRAQQAGAAAG